MGIKILTDGATCMCPHGGQLQFIVTHKTADGADGEVLTLKDYGNALVSGCALPPNAGGPCLKVAMVQDPVGQVMKVKGDTVVTEMVISMTDKGYPITVVSPGRSAISIDFAPVGSTPRQPGQHEVERQNQILAFGREQAQTLARAAESGLPFCEECNRLAGQPDKNKKVISAQWGSDYARRDEIVKLHGRTKGFGDGTPATLEIYEQDADGEHDFTKTLTSTVQGNRVNAEWAFEYQKDVDDLPDKVEGDEHYYYPEYFFDLKVGGKSAQSGLIRFIDWIEIELVTEEGEVVPNADYVAYFADGSEREGKLDEEGKAKLEDIPPGKVHFEFSDGSQTSSQNNESNNY